MDLDDINRMTLSELRRFVAELTRRFGETAALPLGARMPDDTFQQFAERVLREHDDRMARYGQLHEDHVEHMARLDRQYEKLTEIAMDIAQTQDRMETQTHRLTRVESELRTLLAETAVRITHNEAMLQILINMQRHQNGGQTP